MRIYTKRIIISLLALLLGLSVVACGGDDNTEVTTPNDSVIPALSNPNEVFIENGQYSITYQDLYKQLKINDGTNQLLNMVDIDLLSDYMDSFSTREVEERTNKLIYGTYDPAEIAELSDEDKTEMETSFNNSMYLLGYQNSVEEYIRLVLAREAYAIEQMFDADNSDESWYIDPARIAEEYDENYNYDINTIKIKFMSETDANNVLELFNLVSINGELKLYIGTTPLSEVSSSSLNSTNTRSLTDAEILKEFIKMYNYVYGDFKTLIDEEATITTLLANDDLVAKYDDVALANQTLDEFMYIVLGTYVGYTEGTDTKMYYTYEPVKYFGSNDTAYYMILNLDKTEKADVEDFSGTETDLMLLIGLAIYDEIEQQFIDANIDTLSFISSRLSKIREEHGFVINDYYLGMDYKNIDSDFETSAEGHESIVASYDDVDITADQLLAFALSNNAPLYTIYASQTKAVVAAHYSDVYCEEGSPCVTDVLANESDAMAQHNSDYSYMSTQFYESYYSSYYTFDEYLYLAFGAISKSDMMLNYYVKANLQPYFIYDEISSSDYDALDELVSLAQPYYDNYFSLHAQHILIYFDRDENGRPDNYEDFYADLADQTTYDQLLEDFQTAILAYLDDEENTMTSLITTYRKADREDPTWGDFKDFGFYILTENLGDLNYFGTIGKYEDSFVDGLIDIYHDYLLPANINEDSLFGTDLVESSYGMHIILAEKGNDFDMPSAKFVMTYDSETDEPEYLAGLVNSSDEVSLSQLKIYADYSFVNIVNNDEVLSSVYDIEEIDIPASVLEALDTFYKDLYEAMYVIGYMNYTIIGQLSTSDYTNAVGTYCTMTENTFNERISNIADIYMYQIFNEYDLR